MKIQWVLGPTLEAWKRAQAPPPNVNQGNPKDLSSLDTICLTKEIQCHSFINDCSINKFN